MNATARKEGGMKKLDGRIPIGPGRGVETPGSSTSQV